MANTKRKLSSKVKRLLLNFEEDEQQIRQDKQQTKQALERLLKTSKARKT